MAAFSQTEIERQLEAFHTSANTLRPLARELQIRTLAALAIILDVDRDVIARLRAVCK